MLSIRTPDLDFIKQSYTPTFLVHPPILRNTEAGCIASLNLGFANFTQDPAEQVLQIKMLASYIVWLNKAGVVALMFQESPAPETEHFALLVKEIELLHSGIFDIDAMKQSYKVTAETNAGTSCLLQRDKISYSPQTQEHSRTSETMYCDVYTLYLLDGTNRKFNIVNVHGNFEQQEGMIHIIHMAILANFMICGDWNVSADNQLFPGYFKSCGESLSTNSQNRLYGFYDAASLILRRQQEYREGDVFQAFRPEKKFEKEKYISALKYYWCLSLLSRHPENCNLSVANEIAEKSWVQYQNVCNMFATRSYSLNKVKEPLAFKLEAIAQLHIHSWINVVSIEFSHVELQEISKINFPSHLLQSIVDLPRYFWSAETEYEEAFVGGNTPLMTYISNSDARRARLFIDLNADVNQYSAKDGNTALLLAISKGWNHRDRDSEENRPLRSRLFIPSYPQREIIHSLLCHHANVNAIHLANGMTSLHIACLRGDDEELINLLLEKGADATVKDYLGRTPYDLLSIGYQEAQKIITELTVDVTDRRALARGNGIESYNFGAHGRPENLSDTATLPTKHDRSANLFKIQEILSASAKLKSH